METNIQPDFTKYADGLMPCIVQDASTARVLMMGYMNEAALVQTLSEERVTFFSRSKQRLWTKGETSGHYLVLHDILLDCDRDCILVKATPSGPVCHTGNDTCFNEKNEPCFLEQLQSIIQDRKNTGDSSSYIAGLFSKGINKIAQKVGEEAVELVIEAKDNDRQLFKEEAADLLFHYLILLQAKGVSLAEVTGLLEQRHQKKSR